jgi:anaerobic dimethyl sulfoxide reductase subunit A
MYNQRGSIAVKVRVTPRVAPGVFALGQGAWYSPGNTVGSTGHTLDEGGAINSLTRYQPSPVAKGNPQHTIRVAIKKI